MAENENKTYAKILIAEDTPIQGKKLKFYLEKFGYEVDWAEDGQIAWDLFLKNGNYELVVTDVQMPNLDGLGLLEKIKASENDHVPVIVLTTLKDDDTLLKALELGASEFLNKPFRPQELKLRVQNLVALSKFQNMVLGENEQLSEQLIEKNRILEQNFAELKTAHDAMAQMKTHLIQSAKTSALGVMGAGIAHEINNPLAIIDGYNERLQQLIENNQFHKDHLDKVNKKIKDSTERIRKVVLHIKEFAQGSNNEEVSPQDFDIMDMLQNLSIFFGQRTQMGDVKIEFVLPETPILVHAVPAAIEHALFNIVHNAIDAVEKTDKKNVQVKLSVADNRVFIKVTDTGSGIPKDLEFKIYDPFFTTKEIGRGMGLGLSVARSYLEDYGGDIEFESDESKGTCFTVTFPIKEAA